MQHGNNWNIRSTRKWYTHTHTKRKRAKRNERNTGETKLPCNSSSALYADELWNDEKTHTFSLNMRISFAYYSECLAFLFCVFLPSFISICSAVAMFCPLCALKFAYARCGVSKSSLFVLLRSRSVDTRLCVAERARARVCQACVNGIVFCRRRSIHRAFDSRFIPPRAGHVPAMHTFGWLFFSCRNFAERSHTHTRTVTASLSRRLHFLRIFLYPW